jgi:hypothetical protein
MDRRAAPTRRPLGRAPLWVLRGAWLAQAATLGTYGDALEGRRSAVRAVAAVCLWAGWGAVLVALLVPAVATLTVVRMAVPAALVASVWAALAGGGGAVGAVAIALAALATLSAFSGDVGQDFVQASAYGSEQRLLLRPPPAWVVIVCLTWLIAAAGVLAGPILLAAGVWWLGAPALVIGALVAWQGGIRIHRLSRRWLVFVPAGVVVHDHVLLADAHLFRTIDVAHIGLAMEGTGAADFTGGALGPAIEIRLRDMLDVLLHPTPAEPRGKMLHVRSMLVSPTRPGRALALAGEARLTTG